MEATSLLLAGSACSDLIAHVGNWRTSLMICPPVALHNSGKQASMELISYSQWGVVALQEYISEQ